MERKAAMFTKQGDIDLLLMEKSAPGDYALTFSVLLRACVVAYALKFNLPLTLMLFFLRFTLRKFNCIQEQQIKLLIFI